jgi:hypothetical protein
MKRRDSSWPFCGGTNPDIVIAWRSLLRGSGHVRRTAPFDALVAMAA